MSRSSPSAFSFARLPLLAGACLAALGAWAFTVRGGANVMPTPIDPEAAASAQNPLPAGALDGGVAWINAAGPIRLEELRGKVVILDFWTFCCINCHHILPDLAKLEAKYPNELVVIGVHSPKFEAERETENIRRKVREYQIKHPVINDANMEIWRKFGVNSWPTLVVIDPNGAYVGSISGEGHYDVLDREVGKLVREAKLAGKLNPTPFIVHPELDKPHTSPLLFPGKVLADAANNRLFISDNGHHRIVVTDLDGKFLEAIGNGEQGLKDGDYATAQFYRPQGMALLGETLYVADTENHAIRAIDLKAKKVATASGTGQQTYKRNGRYPARGTSLNSPWDVTVLPGGRKLAIAMAGPHQIWTLDLDTNSIGVFAGNGREDIIDGSLDDSSFAQPSGLATDGRSLFVADSEGSAVRAIRLAPGQVTTIAGTHDLPSGQSLFAFGDEEGVAPNSRLQHCLGVAYADGTVYVADSYNNKIKAIDVRRAAAATLVGTGKPGDSDSEGSFYEPGGLSVAGEMLYVADTNNHAIRVVDLKSKAVRTLALEGVTAPKPPARAPKFNNPAVTKLGATKVKPGAAVTLDVAVDLPGYKLAPEAPLTYLVESPDKLGILGSGVSPTGAKVDPATPTFQVAVPLAKPGAAGETIPLKFSLSAFVCSKDGGFCTVKNFVWEIPVEFADDGAARVALTTPAPATRAAAGR